LSILNPSAKQMISVMRLLLVDLIFKRGFFLKKTLYEENNNSFSRIANETLLIQMSKINSLITWKASSSIVFESESI